MRNKFLLLPAIGIWFLAFTSCKHNTAPLALFIPKDADMVLEVDMKSLTDKISSSGITLDSLANMFEENESGLHWNDIENSGIDLTKSFFVFSRQNNSMQAGKNASYGLIAPVTDKNKLETFLKKQVGSAETKQDDKYQYINMGNNNIAGWNNNVLIIYGVAYRAGNSADATLLHQQLTTLFTQNKSNSITSADGFNDMLNKTGDIHFWSNSSAGLNAIPALGMTKMSTLFENTYTEGTIDFENGKAVAKAETHFNKTLSDILEKYTSKEIDKSMISHYPEPVDGFGIAAFNPKVLLDILHYIGFDMMADGYVSQMGFTTNDIVNAFSGNMAFVFSDFKMEDQKMQQMPGMPMKKPVGDFLVTVAIGDRTAFYKVMNGLVNKNILSKNGNQYQLGLFGGHGFVIETNDKNLFIASNDALIQSYKAGNNKSALPGDVEKEINNKSMAMYVDVAAMLKKTNTSDTSSLNVMQAAEATFKNFIASADKSNGKSISGNLELNFINTNENSLASLVKFMAVTHAEKMKHQSGWTKYSPLSHLHDADSSVEEKDSE